MTTDIAGFRALYERYSPHVHRFALFLCADPALADDITSETFVRAWTSFESIRQETVKAYLFTIARHLYSDSQRRSHRLSVLDGDIPDESVSPQKKAEDQSELDAVLTAMQALTEHDRVALLMRALEQMSYEEIAKATGTSVAAAKVRVHRARVKLMHSTKSQFGREPR
jgi:RNA polymerase sigma-70 factor (ECF subfamily)